MKTKHYARVSRIFKDLKNYPNSSVINSDNSSSDRTSVKSVKVDLLSNPGI